MDEFEIELFIMDAEEEYSEIMKDKEKEYKAPDWFLIGLGIQGAPTERHRMHAKQLYLDFIKFGQGQTGKSFKQLVEAFTLAKQQNRI